MKSIYSSGSADRIGISGPSSDIGEAGSGIELSTRDDDDLKRVEAALRRLDRGDFGHCLYCGDQISVKRLDRDPAIDSCGTCDED